MVHIETGAVNLFITGAPVWLGLLRCNTGFMCSFYSQAVFRVLSPRG